MNTIHFLIPANLNKRHGKKLIDGLLTRFRFQVTRVEIDWENKQINIEYSYNGPSFTSITDDISNYVNGFFAAIK